MVIRLSPEEVAARSRRNVWIGLALVAFVVLLFSTTFLRMQANQKAEREKEAASAAAASNGPMHPGKTYDSTLAR